MPAREWTPRIVGGTDMPHANSQRIPVPADSALDFILNPSEKLVTMTYAGLCEIMNAEPRGSNMSWHYGPVIDILDGLDAVRGQCVVEFNGEMKTKTYWVPQ